ncbi:hypothetical protein [Plantibacter sp. YIM 135347]|uniref:hypothetical protein n=1 Tax=Plantibacter sp. YIM 135347 TaxID=3423919 RepID=UPI003D327CF4
MKRWGIGMLLAALTAVSFAGCGIFDGAVLASGGLQSALDRSPAVERATVDYTPASTGRSGAVRTDVVVKPDASAGRIEAMLHDAATRLTEAELKDVFRTLTVSSSDGGWTIAVAAREVLGQANRIDEAVDYVLLADDLPGSITVTLGTPARPTWTGVRLAVDEDEPVESATALFADFASRPLPVWGIDDTLLSIETPAPEGGSRSSVTTLASESGQFTDAVYLASAGVLGVRSLLGTGDATDIRITWKLTVPMLDVVIDARPADPAGPLRATVDAQARGALAASGLPFTLTVR